MNKKTIFTLLSLLAFSGLSFANKEMPEAQPLKSKVAACYATAKDDNQQHMCLERELKEVEAEHKDVMERIIGIAKSWDKPYKTKQRWNKIIRAQQSFDTFVKRECDFVRFTTKGSKTKELNAELACKINYLRVHINILENHYLSAIR